MSEPAGRMPIMGVSALGRRLVNHEIENALMPMRMVIAHYIRYQRGKHRSRNYIKQALSCNKWIMDHLADFHEDKEDRALVKVFDTGGSPATVNTYRNMRSRWRHGPSESLAYSIAIR